MKQHYHLRHILAFLSFFYCFSVSLFAQGTAPVPQQLPYTQDFSMLLHSSTSYPAGFQGWNASSSPGATFNTSGTIVADRVLVASSSASTTSGNVHNYNDKIGFLNTNSLDLTLGFAFNTTNKSGIVVAYDAMVIRNPFNGTSNTRINELVLQYRTGVTNAFTNLAATVYANGTSPQASGVNGQDNQKIKVTLPSECDNQDIVQIRWISRQVSGIGSRPSFAIDNLSLINDVVSPVNAVGYPQISNVISDQFDFTAQLDEAGKTYYVVLPAGSAEPSIPQIKAGTTVTNTTALKAGIVTLTDANIAFTQKIEGLTLGTTYLVYSISEDVFGNTQSSVNKLVATTASFLVPALTTTKTDIDFSFTEQNFSSAIQSYELQGVNLNGAVTINATGNFTISKNQSTSFQSNLVFVSADFINGASPIIYVKFTPDTTGAFIGQITHESNNAAKKIVSLLGTGINPYMQDFNNANVLTNSGWKEYSVTGNTVKWVSTTTRFNSSPAAVQINGYAETGESKDWLISPNLRLSSFDQFPLLSFYSRKFFSGPALKLLVSVNYDGKSNPETATWTALEGDFPTTTGTFKTSQYINLQDYKTDHTYVAWVYETTAGGGTNTAEWTIDDVNISNKTSFLASNPELNFGEIDINTISVSQSFIFVAGGYGDITITAPTDYQLSFDNSSFQSTLTVLAADAIAGKTIFVRFAPSTKTLSISGVFRVVGTGLDQTIGLLDGSSLPKSETFDIATYNLEFFGTDVKNISNVEFGPADDALQIDNVAKVMNTLNADVYAVQEVSDDAALETLIQKISINGKTFDKAISPVWSRSYQAPDPNFPPQKLVVIYNTKTTTVKNTRVMFNQLYNDLRAGTKTLPNYPDVASTFFSSGRLPYIVDIETNINGIKKDLKIINIHARANSGNDIVKYNQRKYDADVLKDSLDAQYPDANLIILGDFNDDVDESVIAGKPSSFQGMVEDVARYNPLTLEISKAGAFSYLSSGGFLDHIMISNELTGDYVPHSIKVYDPRIDVLNYVNTTSDHGPVMARFKLKADTNLSSNDFVNKNKLSVISYPNPTSESFNVTINSINKVDLELNIYDMLGRSMGKSVKINGSNGENSIKINSTRLPVGIYIYTISSGNKIVFRDKIIKK